MEVTYFRKRINGPEAALESLVAGKLCDFFAKPDVCHWMGGSVPVGAGMPDLVFIAYNPALQALCGARMNCDEVLSYLRTSDGASFDCLATKMRVAKRTLRTSLADLSKADAVVENDGHFAISATWRHILPEVITVEVKISDWRGAIQQAARNRIFSDKSYVALPAKLANKIKSEFVVHRLGIGVLAVSDDGDVVEVKDALSAQTKVWSYYYRLASLVAQSNVHQCHT